MSSSSPQLLWLLRLMWRGRGNYIWVAWRFSPLFVRNENGAIHFFISRNPDDSNALAMAATVTATTPQPPSPPIDHTCQVTVPKSAAVFFREHFQVPTYVLNTCKGDEVHGSYETLWRAHRRIPHTESCQRSQASREANPPMGHPDCVVM